MSDKVRIPAAVWEGLEAVRQSGYTNMFDRPRVIELAELLGYAETAEWVRSQRVSYYYYRAHFTPPSGAPDAIVRGDSSFPGLPSVSDAESATSGGGAPA